MFDRMKAATRSAPTLTRGLTQQIRMSDWRAVMDSTQRQRSIDTWNKVPVPERVARRAAENIDIDENGCWISRYSVASHGYAQIGWSANGKTWMVLAHRASWTHFRGQVPMGMTIDHTCHVRKCVNPDHLRLLSNFENSRRTKGRDAEMGYCVNGHDNSNLVETKRRTKSGERRIGLTCRECAVASRSRWEAKNRWFLGQSIQCPVCGSVMLVRSAYDHRCRRSGEWDVSAAVKSIVSDRARDMTNG